MVQEIGASGGSARPDEGASARLARLERQFAETQRLGHLGSWDWDVVTDEISWSDELYRIYGVDPAGFEATYEAYLSRMHPEDRAMVDDTVQAAYRTHRAYAIDHRIVRPDGQVRWVHGRGEVVVGEQGEVERLYGVAVDITDRKRSEMFLRTFIANAAHELRTPVTALSQGIALLVGGDVEAGTSDHASTLEALARQAGRLKDLTASLLDLSALEQGAYSMMVAPVGVKGAVEAALQSVVFPADRSVRVHVSDDVAVVADEDELVRVFMGLLDNAACYGGPDIEVTAVVAGGEVTVDVADDGTGVPDELVDDLFAPFTRGGPQSGGGRGLGLAIVKGLVQAFGGAIEYRARPGGGAIFRLRLAQAAPDGTV